MHRDWPDSEANGEVGEAASWIVDDDAWSGAGSSETATPPTDGDDASATAGPPQGGYASWATAAPPPGGTGSPDARAGAWGGGPGTAGTDGPAPPGPSRDGGSAAGWEAWGGSTVHSEPASAWREAEDAPGLPDEPDRSDRPGGQAEGAWFFEGDSFDEQDVQDNLHGDGSGVNAPPRGRVPHLPAALTGPGLVTFVVICAGVALVLASIMSHPQVP